jgi:predicted enzyme related to lactoylglutathione lyase
MRLFVLLFLACASAFASTLGPDGQSGQSLPGKVVWLDLATENPAYAQAFYGEVFGWKFHAVPGAPSDYTLIENANGKVAGMFRHARPEGAKVSARWLTVISVRDPQAAARVVQESGGQVLVPPKAVAGRGVHAVFRDPEGAVFGVLATEAGDPPDTPVNDGDVFWLDLFARDPQKEASFYAALFGYEVEVGQIQGRMRTVLSTNGIARAGVAPLPQGAPNASWLPYILVDDVPATLARVRAAGGRVLMEPRADLLEGNVAVIADPQGGALGIVNWVTP